jgi:hypothetical protein
MSEKSIPQDIQSTDEGLSAQGNSTEDVEEVTTDLLELSLRTNHQLEA